MLNVPGKWIWGHWKNYFGLLLCTWELTFISAGTSVTSWSSLRCHSLCTWANIHGWIPGNGTGKSMKRVRRPWWPSWRNVIAQSWSKFLALRKLGIRIIAHDPSLILGSRSISSLRDKGGSPPVLNQGAAIFIRLGEWGPEFNNGKSIKTKRT